MTLLMFEQLKIQYKVLLISLRNGNHRQLYHPTELSGVHMKRESITLKVKHALNAISGVIVIGSQESYYYDET